MEKEEYEYTPRWMLKRLKILWENFDSKEFSFDDAARVLKDDNERALAVVLSRLVKNGWLSSERKKEKYARAVYKITNPQTVEEISKVKF